VAVSQSGELRWTLLPGKGGQWQAQLRRAQAVARFTDTGLAIARWLVQRKIEGQRDVLRELGKRDAILKVTWPTFDVSVALAKLQAIFARVEEVQTVPALRQVEGEAADAYWSGWMGLPLHFLPASYRKRVPAHWSSFRGRGSPLNRGNRNAADPVNCLINYCYALLEASAHMGIHESGLDPYLDVTGLHTDQDTRRSLCYTIMEPCRPVADRLVLSFVLSHAFRSGELWSLRDGRCRLDQDLCARLWYWMPQFRRALGPIMTYILKNLRGGPKYGERTGFRLIEMEPPVRSRAPLGQKRWARVAAPPRLRPAGVCRSCGALLEQTPNREYCDTCFPARHREVIATFAAAGASTLAKLREEGRDPTKTPDARRKHGVTMARRNAEIRAWERQHPGRHDPEVFRNTILPRLARVPLSKMIRATGLSLRSCSRVRQGQVVQHARHWEALRRLVSAKQ
jgi:CRISPR-associated endonuclease Cas1